MDPVILHSFLGDRTGNIVTYEETRILATCSQYYAQKNTGLKTVLYTDKIGAELLKDIPYDEVILFDEEIIKQFPKHVWSAGKILAMSMEKRPFIHIDFDFFILKRDFLDSIIDAPFFAYHNEPWSAYLGKKGCFNKEGVQIILQVINESLNIPTNQTFISVNFSIFGSCIEKNIPIINKVSQKMIDCIIKHREFLDSNDLLEQLKKPFQRIHAIMIPLVIEQVLLLKMIHKELKKYKTLIKIQHPRESYSEGIKIGLAHLWEAKNFPVITKKINLLYKSIINKSFN